MTQLNLPEIPTEQIVFRPIHYLGSKLRLLPAIRSAIEKIEPVGPLCDLFAGSGTVALGMADVRPVVAVDIQEYSRVLCSALLLPPVDPRELGATVARVARDSELFGRLNSALAPVIDYEEECVWRALEGDPEPLADFIEHGSLAWFVRTGASMASRRLRLALQAVTQRMQDTAFSQTPGSLITRHFGGAYFSFRQAAALDALLEAGHQLPQELRDAGIAPILSTASEVVNTVGKHFAQPIRARKATGQPKSQLVRRIISDRRLDVFLTHQIFVERYGRAPATAGPNLAIRDDYENFLNTFCGRIAVFYADPPYTRDHYSRFYHVLETMCLRDEPEMSYSMIRTGRIPRVSRGFYRIDRHQSPFCIKSQAPGAFARLFAGTARFNVPLVLSYSPFDEKTTARPRLMSIGQIAALAREHFRKVEIVSAGRFAHSKLNLQDRNAPINRAAEVLLTCRP